MSKFKEAWGCRTLLFAFFCGAFSFSCLSQDIATGVTGKSIDSLAGSMMRKGDIPGMAIVILSGDRQLIRTYGYADRAAQRPITPFTLFQLGSCSKAFTSLAMLRLAKEQNLCLDSPVTQFLPWFRATYKDTTEQVTLAELLHHTSGIPWQAIAEISEGRDAGALERTIRRLSGIRLHHRPGERYEYATINYDILALVIQKRTNLSFEEYLQKSVIDALQMSWSSVGEPLSADSMSVGYKIGFFRARQYGAPVFRANNAAGYVISNAVDLVKWLQFQLGRTNEELYRLARVTQQRDETVPLHNMSSYGMGWDISLSGNGAIYHDGLNPNFTSFIALRPARQTAIAILANSNSSYTSETGNRLLEILAGEKHLPGPEPGDGGDDAFSLVSLLLAGYVAVLIIFLIRCVIRVRAGERKYQGPFLPIMLKFLKALLMAAPFLAGLYVLPRAIAGFTWDSILVWTPVSFKVMTGLVLVSLAVSYLAYLAGLLFPERNSFVGLFPRIALISVLSGIANMVVIVLVTSALAAQMELRYLVFYYLIAISVYLFGRWFVQVNLIRITREFVGRLRRELIGKILATTYQRFEAIHRGRIYTALNDDIETIGNSTGMFVLLVTSTITAVGAFLYLASLAFWAAMLASLLIILVAGIYYFVGRKNSRSYAEGRAANGEFIRLINHLIDGYKEISLHRNKKDAFRTDMLNKADTYKEKIAAADIRFANAFLVGESLLLVLLGTISFAVPEIFPGISAYTVTGFVLVLLYLIGPINGVLNSIPAMAQLKVAWQRVRQFRRDIPEAIVMHPVVGRTLPVVHNFSVADLTFRYGNNDQGGFEVGPVNLEILRGEILFIVGGNGSGKTTLAKLLTGLYEPLGGAILINGRMIDRQRLGEFFSVVFNPLYLFEDLYDPDVTHRKDEVRNRLDVLQLKDKVEISENRYNTIDLSGGQRKRLALLQCYLEDAPIFLFDEWAADQDPSYRNFFYRTLLPEMKAIGKLVIAITHDDHYFDVADKILKMDGGKLTEYKAEQTFAR